MQHAVPPVPRGALRPARRRAARDARPRARRAPRGCAACAGWAEQAARGHPARAAGRGPALCPISPPPCWPRCRVSCPARRRPPASRLADTALRLALLAVGRRRRPALAWPALASGAGAMSAPVHVAHETGAWNLAVAAAFLAVAAGPAARGGRAALPRHVRRPARAGDPGRPRRRARARRPRGGPPAAAGRRRAGRRLAWRGRRRPCRRARSPAGGCPREAGAALLLALVTGWLLAGVADRAVRPSAHAELVSTDPAEGARLEQAPAQVTLRVQRGRLARRRLRARSTADGDGRRRHRRRSTAARSPSRCAATSPDDGYLVTYRVVSADSHPIAGRLLLRRRRRRARPGGRSADGDATDPAVAVALPVARWLGLRRARARRRRARAGAALLAGGLGVGPAAPAGRRRRGRGRRRRGRQLPAAGSVRGGGPGSASVARPRAAGGHGRLRAPAGRCWPGPSWRSPWPLLLRPSGGAATRRRAVEVAAGARRSRRAWSSARRRSATRSPGRGRGWRWPSPPCTSPPWPSGSAAWPACWPACCGPGRPRTRSPRRCRRFSRLAFASVAALVVSGTVQAVREVESPTALFVTTYGWVLVAKLVLVAGRARRGRRLPGVGAAAPRASAGPRPGRRRSLTAHAFAAVGGGRDRSRSRTAEAAAAARAPAVGERRRARARRCAARCWSRSPSPPSSWRCPPSSSAPRPPGRPSPSRSTSLLPLQGSAGPVGQRAGVGGPGPARAATRCTSTSSTTPAGSPSPPAITVTLTEPAQEIGPLDVDLQPAGPGPLRRRRHGHPRRRHLDPRRQRPPRRVHRHHGPHRPSRSADPRPHDPTPMNRSSVSLPRAPRPARRSARRRRWPRSPPRSPRRRGVASAHVTVSSHRRRPRRLREAHLPRARTRATRPAPSALRIQIPEEAALASLRAQPVPGWTATLTTTDLDGAARDDARAGDHLLRVGRRVPRRRGRRHRAGRVPGVRAVRRPVPRRRLALLPDGADSTATAPRRPGSSRPSRARPSPSARRPCSPSPPSTSGGDPAATRRRGRRRRPLARRRRRTSPGGLALFLSILALLAGIAGVVLGLAGAPTYRVLVSSAVRAAVCARPWRRCSLAAGLALAGCGGRRPPRATADGHDHSGGSGRQVEGPDDATPGLDLAEPYRRPSFTLTDTTGAPYDFKAADGGPADAAVLRLHELPRRLPDDDGRRRGRPARAGPGGGRAAAGGLRDHRPGHRHPRGAGGVPGPVRRRPARRRSSGSPATRRRSTRRSCPPACRWPRTTGRLHSSLLLLYGHRRRGARRLRRRQHLPRHRRRPAAWWRARREPGGGPAARRPARRARHPGASPGRRRRTSAAARRAATSTAGSCR